MKRLTAKHDGQISILLRTEGNEKNSWILSGERLYGDAADRLSAYEDTGLEPKDIQEAVDLFSDFNKVNIPA